MCIRCLSSVLASLRTLDRLKPHFVEQDCEHGGAQYGEGSLGRKKIEYLVQFQSIHGPMCLLYHCVARLHYVVDLYDTGLDLLLLLVQFFDSAIDDFNLQVAVDKCGLSVVNLGDTFLDSFQLGHMRIKGVIHSLVHLNKHCVICLSQSMHTPYFDLRTTCCEVFNEPRARLNICDLIVVSQAGWVRER